MGLEKSDREVPGVRVIFKRTRAIPGTLGA